MKKLFASLMIIFGLAVIPAYGTAVAIDLFPNDLIKGDDAKTVEAKGGVLGVKVQKIINLALYLISGVAVIMIIIGGLRMAISNGDASAVKSGKLTILWSVIGLGVAIFASAIVNFVVNWNWG